MSIISTEIAKAMLIHVLSELDNINPYAETTAETNEKINVITYYVKNYLEGL